ncbi:3-oxoacyl-ACP synthase III [Desulfonema magnum]|uniref:3-oxoacyl-[acyl-carrier-protein] synthase 3 n=1 Tax=Desulfonema magnum TaxID=45655 RepID=A0A975BWW3_9BACT|nr:3-oxoacyl-ACP synthase III [Desulfonema magnum]QTA92823.1 Putative 3-oxoacyl-[acyl-carrier-protein] synthase 3 [Desulfonema magnum]
MNYSKVYINAFGYELPPNVVTSEDLEERLEPLYKKLHLQKGQLEAITGIYERRFWDPGYKMYEGAVAAGQKAIEASDISVQDIGMLIYGGVCRDNLEPATACAVSHGLGLVPETQVYDISNACLGILNGMVHIANAIELGQIRAGLVVSCESSRQIVDITIERLLKHPDMELFKKTIATMTGGSGAVAVLLTDASVSSQGHQLMGGIARSAAEHHKLCMWGPDAGRTAEGIEVMQTDSIGVLQNGVALGTETFRAFKKEFSLPDDKPDKVICHQVGAAHQKTILESVGIPKEKDFTTFQYLGNIGTVSLPITAAIASEREFLAKNDLVGFFGIGSGLNCMMLGVRW